VIRLEEAAARGGGECCHCEQGGGCDAFQHGSRLWNREALATKFHAPALSDTAAFAQAGVQVAVMPPKSGRSLKLSMV
jgi:hypothetical protein